MITEPGPNRSMPRESGKWPRPATPGREHDRATPEPFPGSSRGAIGAALSRTARIWNCGKGATGLQIQRSVAFPPIWRLNLFLRCSRQLVSTKTCTSPNPAILLSPFTRCFRSSACRRLVIGALSTVFLCLCQPHCLECRLWIRVSKLGVGAAHDSRNVCWSWLDRAPAD
jgi:hypothetical protein